jgi:hypothetical protein
VTGPAEWYEYAVVLARTAVRVVALPSALGFVLGCQTIDRFDTGGASAYCGKIVDSKFVWTPATIGGFDRNLQVELKLDTSALASEPGRITSNDAANDTPPCGKDNPGVPTFDGAKLMVTPEVANDALSALTFEDGQVHNIMAWVDSSCQGRMIAVVSLYKSSHVELRLMKPVTGAPGSDQRDAFALFPLERRDEGCGFKK